MVQWYCVDGMGEVVVEARMEGMVVVFVTIRKETEGLTVSLYLKVEVEDVWRVGDNE